jgi:hypothetical protein
MAKRRTPTDLIPGPHPGYGALLAGISDLLGQAGRAAARAVNTVLTATYWEVGRRLIEFEQGGKRRAGYGEGLLRQLGQDLTAKHGRGFSERNLRQMRSFYLGWEIRQTASAKFQAQAKDSPFADAAGLVPVTAPDFAAVAFPLPWSHYVRLLSVENSTARAFYEAEAVRGGWSSSARSGSHG